MNLPTLPQFSPPGIQGTEFLPRLGAGRMRRIVNFVLGPAGTNISQAARAWVARHELDGVAEFVLCRTPEEALAQARLVKEAGVVPIFWTCAVYIALNQLFFNNPDVFPFLFSFDFPLDNMQLCVRREFEGQDWGKNWRISSHPSPAPLVGRELLDQVSLTTSNAQAAKLCAAGEAEACITTEQAARAHGLVTVHEFGSPKMVFFGGTTQHGMRVLLGR